ncbi:MAG: CoA-binding protein [Actinomycetota bacterium]
MAIDEELPERILRRSTTIAVVGASRSPDKSAHSVPMAMQAAGFRIIPVNPLVDELFGEKSYPTLADIPEHVDMVDVFRPSEDAAEVARQAVAIGTDAIWLQQGIVSDDARRIADEAGIDYVEDRCMAVERAKAQITKG